MKTFPGKLFLSLWIPAVLSVVAVLPYALTLQAATLRNAGLSLPAVIGAAVVQSSVLLALAVGLGLVLARRVGFGCPLIEKLLEEGWTGAAPFRDLLRPAFIGLGTGAIIVAGDQVFAAFGIVVRTPHGGADMIWKGLLVSFYGGLGEEILLRLFTVSLLVWLLTFRRWDTRGGWRTIAIALAILLATLLFGLGHLPTVKALVPLTTGAVVRTLVLNGVGGIVFGWLYWRRGLEAAIVAHFAADLVLHVLTPALKMAR